MRKYKKLTIPMMFACSLASFFVGMAFITPTVTETKPLFAEAAVEIPEEYWIDEGNEPEDYAYSFMVIGDTQYLTPYGLLGNVYDYVVDNVASKKVKHVFGVGDIITGWNNPSLPVSDEWTEAKAQITRMDGLVTYSLVRGNHDDPEGFVETFGTDSSYANQYTWCYDNNTLNTIHTFTAGSYNYMVVALNFGPSDEVLEWAGEIIEAHPYHNVIITTHGYSAPDNTTLDKGDNPDAPSYYPEQDTHNNGDDMWNKLVRKYENISMVLSGHIGLTDIIYRQDKGDHGNVVTQMCINPQRLDGNIDGQTGMVATFYVNEDGETVSVEYYSTIREKFFGTQNQFDFTMSSVESKPEFYVDKNVEAFVRAGEVAGEDPNGMRFAFTMSEAQFASLLPQGTTAQTATSFADGVEVGAYLAPASEIRSTAVRVNTEVADLVACATAAKEVLSFKNWKKTENGYTAYVNLYNLPAFGYTEEIFACAYYTVNGQTVYTDLGASSLAKAAQKAIDGGSTETAFTEYLPTKLDAQLYSLDDGTIDVSKVDGEVLAVKYVSGVDIAFTQKGNVVTISGTETLNDSAASGWKLANEALGEITEVKVYTATNTYIIPLKVYSDVIDTAKEFDEMQKFLVNSGVQYNGQECKIIHGYFILADDLDFAEEYPNGYASPFATNAACADNTGGWSHGWNAVFDGNGHTIRGLHLIKNNGNYRNSLFGVIVGRPKELTLRGGVVKNVAFVDCSMANLYGSAFLANRCFGTVENVYLDVTLSTTHDSLDSNAALVGFNRTDGQYNAFGTFNNVTVVVDGLGAKDYVMKGNPDYN
ncbi:MAG: metallophosphoesterase, partial [Clostridia bacterium]|nr:metallophosphoesterase [Clostridia bacterium]